MSNIVEIFQTNVTCFNDASYIVEKIQRNFPFYTTNFDLEDRDNILRIEATLPINTSEICDLLSKEGFTGILIQ